MHRPCLTAPPGFAVLFALRISSEITYAYLRIALHCVNVLVHVHVGNCAVQFTAGAPTAGSNLCFVVTGHRLPGHGFAGSPAVYDAGRDAIYVLGGGETVQYSLGTGAVQLIGRFKSSSGAHLVKHGMWIPQSLR